MPAAFCGVIGLKTSFGRIPHSGVLPLNWTGGMVGILAGTVEDSLIVYATISGEAELQDFITEFQTEVDLLCKIHHPNIITLLGYCFHDEHDGSNKCSMKCPNEIMWPVYSKSGSISSYNLTLKSEIKQTRRRIEIIKRKRNAMQKFLRNDVADLHKKGLDSNAYGRIEITSEEFCAVRF